LVGKNSFAPPFNGWEYQDCHTNIPGKMFDDFSNHLSNPCKKKRRISKHFLPGNDAVVILMFSARHCAKVHDLK